MPSNEAIELLESVLSSVNESERWQYRVGDILEEQKERERKRVLMGKNDREYNNIAIPSKYLKRARNGAPAYYRDDIKKALNSALAPAGSIIQNPTPAFEYDEDHGMYINERQPKHKDMHERINRRTKEYDTTAKHEAACILIEALNTLLNE